MEFASAYETDVANLHGSIRVPWGRHPQCMSVRRIFDRELIAEDIVFSHLDHPKGQDEFPTLVGVRWALYLNVNVEDVTAA